MRYQPRPAPVACHARIWVADDQTTDSPIIFSWFSNDKDTVHNTELTRFILHPNTEPYPPVVSPRNCVVYCGYPG